MAKPSQRLAERAALLDQRAYDARLRLTPELAGAPLEQGGEERQRHALAWAGMQVPPEESATDRAELEKLDRALLASRKQVFAARTQAQTLRAELEQARGERYANPVVYSLGALALAAAGAWLLQRRRLQAGEGMPASPVPATPAAFPPAVEPSAVSEFEESELDVIGDEADQWIQRARVAVPSVQ